MMPIFSAAAPLEPVPAACTATLVDSIAADFASSESAIKALSSRVREEQAFFIENTRDVLPPAPGAEDPFEAAFRFEALGSCLSENQRSTGVELWAKWIESADPDTPVSYCGPGQLGRSFAQDGYLMFSPFISIAKGDDSLVPVAPLVVASGALSFGIDVVTMVPNMFMSTVKFFARKRSHRRSATALRRFVDFAFAMGRCPAGTLAPR